MTPAENPVPDNSPQSIGELRNGHVTNLQELYYTRLVRKMAWYKILIQVLIVQFLRITMCVPYWWCTKHAQLIMGTWPIYKKHFLQLILTKKLSFDKISPRDFFFFFSFLFNLYLCVRRDRRKNVPGSQLTFVTKLRVRNERKTHVTGSCWFVQRVVSAYSVIKRHTHIGKIRRKESTINLVTCESSSCFVVFGCG